MPAAGAVKLPRRKPPVVVARAKGRVFVGIPGVGSVSLKPAEAERLADALRIAAGPPLQPIPPVP